MADARPIVLCAHWQRKRRHVPKPGEQIVVGLVGTDPEPMEAVAFAVRNGAIRSANVRCPDFTLLLERYEGACLSRSAALGFRWLPEWRSRPQGLAVCLKQAWRRSDRPAI